MSKKREKLLQQLEEKFSASGQNLDTHLEGLLHAKYINYWDYIKTDAL
jgi:tryptophan 2,3-dioxygenase